MRVLLRSQIRSRVGKPVISTVGAIGFVIKLSAFLDKRTRQYSFITQEHRNSKSEENRIFSNARVAQKLYVLRNRRTTKKT